MTAPKSIKEKAEDWYVNAIDYKGSENIYQSNLERLFKIVDLAFKAGQEEEREEERKKRNKIIYNYRHNKHKKGICWDCSKKVVNSFYCESCAEKSRIRKLKRYHKIKNLK